jgi:predicted nucleic acid-binding protein
MATVLDTGALIAVDRRNQHVVAQLMKLRSEGTPIITSSAAVAQVVRDPARQSTLQRVLRGVEERALDPQAARDIGRLLARTGTSDVVDAAVALAAQPGDVVLTSDPNDLSLLTEGRSVIVRPI